MVLQLVKQRAEEGFCIQCSRYFVDITKHEHDLQKEITMNKPSPTIEKILEEFELKFMYRGNYIYQVEIKDFLTEKLQEVEREAVKEE